MNNLANISPKVQEFRGKDFVLHGFDFGGALWLLLNEVLETLQLTEADLKILREEEPHDFERLADGREIIKEGGFYYLALFVSETAAAKELSDWVFGTVVPSIMGKGYYSIKEDNNGTTNH